MLNSLGERVCLATERFLVNHSMALLILVLLFVIAADFYNRFLRINRDTYHIDLMKEYSELQMRRRYK